MIYDIYNNLKYDLISPRIVFMIYIISLIYLLQMLFYWKIFLLQFARIFIVFSRF